MSSTTAMGGELLHVSAHAELMSITTVGGDAWHTQLQANQTQQP